MQPSIAASQGTVTGSAARGGKHGHTVGCQERCISQDMPLRWTGCPQLLGFLEAGQSPWPHLGETPQQSASKRASILPAPH